MFRRSSTQFVTRASTLCSALLTVCCASGQTQVSVDDSASRAATPSKVMENTPGTSKYLPLGTWGSKEMAVTVEEGGVSVEMPGANANFTGRPKLSRRGEFDAEGQYNPIGPGAGVIEPGKPEQSPERDPVGPNARFRGKLSGGKLTLTITLLGSNKKIGPYTLEPGKARIIPPPM